MQVSGGITLGLPALFILFIVFAVALYSIYQYYFFITWDRDINRLLFPTTSDGMNKKDLREEIEKHIGGKVDGKVDEDGELENLKF